ncbi:hypothetical protein LTR08_006217 [Meristemomyces frigidus]|nr:hypothetical protein LTR08_006217 [Meristemomyces frigidus]
MLGFLPLLVPIAFGLHATASPTFLSKRSTLELVVTSVPDYVRPYIVRAYSLDGLAVGSQVYRFPVTGPASGGAFTLISTAAPASDALGIHKAHYENFFCLRGSFRLWANDEARLFTPGDYGAVPPSTNHTFQIVDPFSELVGVISPGGFEDLFTVLAQSNYTSVLEAPFTAGPVAATAGGDASIITTLEKYDVYAELEYSPRTDMVNGSAPSTAAWHNAPNTLATDAATPFFVAKDYGPRYLNNATGQYQIIEPLLTPTQTDGNFTMGNIILSRTFARKTPAVYTLPHSHTALEVVDGQLTLKMEKETVELEIGDVAFVPAGTAFSYWSQVAYTKILYIGNGTQTLDQQLLGNAASWDYAVFPSSPPS